MRRCRILSLWFPRLAAERVLRAEPRARRAAARGRRRPARRAGAGEPHGGGRGGGARGAAWRSATPGRSCPGSSPVPPTRPPRPARRARCGAGPGASRPGSPRSAEGLVLDVTGCAQLFGGEAGLVARVEAEAADLGFTVRTGLADTLGRGLGGGALRRGRARGRPMPATRSTRRRGPPARGRRSAAGSAAGRRRCGPRTRSGPTGIVPPGATLAGIGPLPVAALRLEPDDGGAAAGARPRPDRRSRGGCRAPRSAAASAPRWSGGSTRRSAGSPSRSRRRPPQPASRCA